MKTKPCPACGEIIKRISLKEILYLLKNARKALGLLYREERWRREIHPILSLELSNEPLSQEDILIKCYQCRKIPLEQLGPIALSLNCRAGRNGKLSVDNALEVYAANADAVRSGKIQEPK